MKKINKILIVFFIFTSLTVFGTWRFIHSQKFSEQASKKVSEILTKKIGAKLYFTGLEFSIFPPATIFKQVTIKKKVQKKKKRKLLKRITNLLKVQNHLKMVAFTYLLEVRILVPSVVLKLLMEIIVLNIKIKKMLIKNLRKHFQNLNLFLPM